MKPRHLYILAVFLLIMLCLGYRVSRDASNHPDVKWHNEPASDGRLVSVIGSPHHYLLDLAEDDHVCADGIFFTAKGQAMFLSTQEVAERCEVRVWRHGAQYHAVLKVPIRDSERTGYEDICDNCMPVLLEAHE